MESIHKRASIARIVVGLVALVVPLLAVSSAQGSMGVSKTLLPSNRPALTSVTIQGPYVNYCFSTPGGQAITAPAGGYDPTYFTVGGYAYDTVYSATTNPAVQGVVQLNNSCVQASFSPGPDLTSYSYGGVEADGVEANIGGSTKGNLKDSSPLIGSTSHNGTRGLTTGPDLQTAVVDAANSRISYVFDQEVDATAPGFGGYYQFLNQAGVVYSANFTVDVSGNVVTAQFSPGIVGDATVAYVTESSVDSNTPDPETGNPLLTVKVPGSSGNTDNPDLVSAALVGSGTNQVDFVYDTNVALGTACAANNNVDAATACFHAWTSDSQRIDSEDAVVLADGKTVRATFPGTTGKVTELLVAASADDSAAQTPSGSVGSSVGGVPIGDNAGAFSTGYVTGPDAQSLAIDSSTGAATVTFDQRVDPDNFTLSYVRLLNNQGTPIGGSPSSAAVSGTNTPGPVQVVYQFDPSFAASAAGMQLDQYAVSTFEPPSNGGTGPTNEPQYNVAQVLAK